MKKLNFISIGLVLFICSSQLRAQLTVAVLNFENHSFLNKSEYDALSTGLAEMMITTLSQVESIRLIERRNLQNVLDEIKLAQAGVIPDDKARQVGLLLGAKHLVFGSFLVAPGEKIRIDVRLVEVETGLTLKAEEVTGKTKEILKLVSKLSRKLLDKLEIRLTSDEEKRLKKSEHIKLDAILIFAKGVQYEDAGDLQKAGEQYQKALQIEPSFIQAKQKLENISQ